MPIRQRLLACLLASLVLLAAHPAVAQPDEGTTLLGTALTGKPYVLHDDLILETTGLRETIRDYTDPAAPQWVGWNDHDLTGYWQDVVLDGDLLVALRNETFPSGLEIVDMADPTAPVSLSQLSGNLYSSAWMRGGALLLSMPEYAITYDLTDPELPTFSAVTILGEMETSRWFSAVGDVLYLIDHDTTLRVLDVADPLHPVDLGTIDLTGERIDAMVAGDGHLYLLVASDQGGGTSDLDLVTLDVTAPLAPMETDRRTLLAGVHPRGLEMVRADDLLLAATADNRVRAFGLATPSAPVPGWELPHNSEHLTVSMHQLFVLTAGDLFIYPRTDHATLPTDPVRRKILPRLFNVLGDGPVQIAQHYERREYIAGIDVTNPRHPRLGEWYDTGLEGVFIEAEGLGMMVAEESRARLFDMSYPEFPVALGSIYKPGYLFGNPQLSQDAAVISGSVFGDTNLIFDLRNPCAPVFRGIIGHGQPRALVGDLLVCCDESTINLVDLADLSHPELLGSYNLDQIVTRVGLHHDHVFVLTNPAGNPRDLNIIDVQDPTQPQLVCHQALDFTPGQPAFNDTRLYLTSYSETRIYDITDPARPELSAQYPFHGVAGGGVAFNGDITTYCGWIFTRRDDGYGLTDVPAAAAPGPCVLEPAHPNPFNPSTAIAFTVTGERDLTVSVHDVRGRKVADLAGGVFTSGRHTVDWHGRDAAGHAVASGVYLVRLHGAGVELSQTVTLVK